MTEQKPLEVRTSTDSRLSVLPQGGKFTLTLQSFPILISTVRGDSKVGVTHFCTPIFGPDRNSLFNLRQHGNMRNDLCDIKKSSQNEVIISHTLTDENYPEGVQVEATLKLEDTEFSLLLKHTNTGREKAPVNAGVHHYFNAPEGFEGTKINGIDVTEDIKRNPDGYLLPLSPYSSIRIPAMPELFLEQTGFNYLMVWVGRNPTTLEIDKNYICIEPVENDPQGNFFGSNQSLIQPGQTRTSSYRLGINAK